MITDYTIFEKGKESSNKKMQNKRKLATLMLSI